MRIRRGHSNNARNARGSSALAVLGIGLIGCQTASGTLSAGATSSPGSVAPPAELSLDEGLRLGLVAVQEIEPEALEMPACLSAESYGAAMSEARTALGDARDIDGEDSAAALSEGIGCFEIALAFKANDSLALSGRGWAQMQAGSWSAATRDLELARLVAIGERDDEMLSLVSQNLERARQAIAMGTEGPDVCTVEVVDVPEAFARHESFTVAFDVLAGEAAQHAEVPTDEADAEDILCMGECAVGDVNHAVVGEEYTYETHGLVLPIPDSGEVLTLSDIGTNESGDCNNLQRESEILIEELDGGLVQVSAWVIERGEGSNLGWEPYRAGDYYDDGYGYGYHYDDYAYYDYCSVVGETRRDLIIDVAKGEVVLELVRTHSGAPREGLDEDYISVDEDGLKVSGCGFERAFALP